MIKIKDSISAALLCCLLKFLEIHVVESIRGTSVLEAVLPDVFDHFFESFSKLLEILLVKENLVFVISEMTVVVHPALAFSDRQVVIIAFCSLDVKEVCTLSCSYRL